MASTIYGLTPQGFVVKQQQQIISEIQTSLQTAFGQNVNLLPEAVLGQLVGIFSEREALIWQLGEAVYSSQYPAGAEGVSVDNILALSGLKRLPASPTITSSTENNIPGLLLFGTPGTLIPNGSLIAITGSSPQITFSLTQDATIAAALNAIQTLIFTSTPNSGSFTLAIIDPTGTTLTTGSIPYNATGAANRIQTLTFSLVPDAGVFNIKLGSQTTTNLSYTVAAIDVQNAIQALTGYSTATVTGSYTLGFVISLPDGTQPLITNPTNTLTMSSTPVVITDTPNDSVEAEIQGLYNASTGKYPYTDVLVTQDFTAGFFVTFGAGTPTVGNPPSGSQPQNMFTVPVDSLMNGLTVVNVGILNSQVGAPAQAVSAAACTQTGPIFAPAGSLTTIITPISGWSGVNNPLDAIPGSNIETDTAALQRRATRLANAANGPLQSITEKVLAVAQVSAAIGFENITSIVDAFGRPPKCFEIVANGGNDLDIATAIFNSKPAGIESYGTTTVSVIDPYGTPRSISFSRPTLVPIYIVVNLTVNSLFPGNGVQTIQQELVTIGNGYGIGQTVIVFGTNGLIGAFNNVPGILSYVLYAGTAPNPVTQTNIPVTAEQLSFFETFNIVVSFT